MTSGQIMDADAKKRAEAAFQKWMRKEGIETKNPSLRLLAARLWLAAWETAKLDGPSGVAQEDIRRAQVKTKAACAAVADRVADINSEVDDFEVAAGAHVVADKIRDLKLPLPVGLAPPPVAGELTRAHMEITRLHGELRELREKVAGLEGQDGDV